MGMRAEMMSERADKPGKADRPNAPASYEVHDRRGRHTGDHEEVPPPDSNAKEIERLKHEAQHANDKYLRALAEIDNTKKRLSREKEEFARYASETVVRELLPIVDSLDQALVAVDKSADPQSVAKGVRLIHQQLLGLLNREEVKRIPTVGKPFDPHQHEAVAQVDPGDGTADDTVIEEIQVGYTMHGKVIRPAMVKIAKHQSEQPSAISHQLPETDKRKTEEGSESSASATDS